MSTRRFILTLIPFILLIIAGFLLHPGTAPEQLQSPIEDVDKMDLTVGIVSNDLEADHEILASFVSFLNLVLDERKIRLTPFLARSPDKMLDAIMNGEVDIYMDSPFGIYKAVETGTMQVIARQWRNGLAEYHSVILARRESPFAGLNNLDRADIAFEDAGSSSSFFLPAAELHQAGYALVNGEEDLSPAGPGEIRFFFSGWDATSIEWLLSGKVDLAAVSSIYFNKLEEPLRSRTRIVHKTRKIPRHLVAVRSSLGPQQQDLILAVLSDLEASVRGRAVLQAFYDTRRFDPVPYEHELRDQFNVMMESMAWDR